MGWAFDIIFAYLSCSGWRKWLRFRTWFWKNLFERGRSFSCEYFQEPWGWNNRLVAMLWFHSISILYFMAPWNLFMAFPTIINPTQGGIQIFHPYLNLGIKFQQIGISLLSISSKKYLFIYKILSRYLYSAIVFIWI